MGRIMGRWRPPEGTGDGTHVCADCKHTKRLVRGDYCWICQNKREEHPSGTCRSGNTAVGNAPGPERDESDNNCLYAKAFRAFEEREMELV